MSNVDDHAWTLRRRALRPAVAVAALVTLVAGALAQAPAAAAAEGRLDTDALSAATVLISPARYDPTEAGWGSGSVISGDGLVLTNAHVAANRAPGLVVQYPYVRYYPPTPPTLYVYTVGSASDRARPMYQAEVAAVDGYLDLAVLRIVAHADGVALDPGELDLTPVPLGSADDLRPLDVLTVAGYPGLAETFAVRFSRGELHNFSDDPLVGRNAWLHTDAKISGGNSGGMAVDESGRLVAVPTQTTSESAFGAVDFNMRPIDLALPLIEAARTGAPYDEYAHVVRPSGTEVARVAGWSDELSDRCVTGSDEISYGARVVVPQIEFAGMQRGDHVLVELVEFGPGGTSTVVGFHAFDWPDEAGASACLPVPLRYDRAVPSGDYGAFLDGDYGISVRVGPSDEIEAMTPSRTTAVQVLDPFGALDDVTPPFTPAKPRSTPPPARVNTRKPTRAELERELASMLPIATWTPYRSVPRSVRYNPFKRGAQAAVLFDNLEDELHQAVDYAALFRFKNAVKLDGYWNVRAGDVSSRAPWAYEPCSDGRPGRDEWQHGEYLCYVNDAGYASLRWTDERTNTYGVLNLVNGNRSLKTVFKQWKRVR